MVTIVANTSRNHGVPMTGVLRTDEVDTSEEGAVRSVQWRRTPVRWRVRWWWETQGQEVHDIVNCRPKLYLTWPRSTWNSWIRRRDSFVVVTNITSDGCQVFRSIQNFRFTNNLSARQKYFFVKRTVTELIFYMFLNVRTCSAVNDVIHATCKPYTDQLLRCIMSSVCQRLIQWNVNEF